MAGNDTKYQEQVRKGMNGGAPAGDNAPTIAAGPLVRKIDQAEIDKMLTEGGYEYAPQVKSLEEGERVSGILEGNGPMVEFTDDETGVVKEVLTWIVASADGAQRISILSTAQLDKKLPPFVGGPVDIVRGKDIKTSNGRKVTDYLVRGPIRKDGTRRNFVAPPKMIEASVHDASKALPEGTAPAMQEGTPAAAPHAS